MELMLRVSREVPGMETRSGHLSGCVTFFSPVSPGLQVLFRVGTSVLLLLVSKLTDLEVGGSEGPSPLNM